MSSWKQSKIYSMLHAKCPRCHEGNMFAPGTLYNPKKFADMNPVCSCCGQTFEPEPGFYYGAMYVSFGFSTGIFLAVLFGLSFLVEEITMAMVLVSVLVIVVGLLPVNYRLSRVLWLSIFVRYEGPCNQIEKFSKPVSGH